MHGMEPAVTRIRSALLAHEPILIYGDYDVDGTVATVLLKTAIERTAAALGVTPDIRYHIPHRIREGYGMRESRIADAAAEGVRLVISVDTGIRAHAAAEEAARLSLDLIVTDHHLPDELSRLSPRARRPQSQPAPLRLSLQRPLRRRRRIQARASSPRRRSPRSRAATGRD